MIKAGLSRFVSSSAIILAACTFISGCNSNKVASEPTITAEELRAWCPPVTMDTDTAFYNTYTRGGDGKAEQVIYQANFANVTRACQYPAGHISMTVAAAGRIVPGPKFAGGTVTMPILVKAIEGNRVIYSKKHSYSVPISSRTEATQFIFKDDQVSFPTPQGKNVKVFISFDVKAPSRAVVDTFGSVVTE
ncbi:hypothetical protein N5853_09775 [Bartonella sp. HY329]|uniref:hypothetical protein n=1 Tax=unclassified Bartonella TaxID=2645622 RepID=UPI0021C94ABA|nr:MULTISPECIES: hypothetical protein [unclassified Bartonella]UXM94395.1 hypothetical protein N5853_09775 [Bartonella sp. HY329]UXN08718.1 hypothetical protein N5852_09785 [Bartonella sp. HY328]